MLTTGASYGCQKAKGQEDHQEDYQSEVSFSGLAARACFTDMPFFYVRIAVMGEPFLSDAEITAWLQLPFVVLDAAEKYAADAYDIRQSLRGVYTSSPVGVYLRELPGGALHAAVSDEYKQATAQDMALVKSAVSRVIPQTSILEQPDFNSQPAAVLGWIKAAYAPLLHSTGETLNFFPGHYAGTNIPNSPSPVASMLTSGLVGAGLGYGAGWLGEQLMPDSWQKGKLRRTLALAGGGLGVAPGLIWGAVNKSLGRSFNDNSLLNNPAPSLDKPAEDLCAQYLQATDAYVNNFVNMTKQAGDDDSFLSGYRDTTPAGPMSINVDSIGRTLWEAGTSPQTAGMTMGVLAAAGQMPGGGNDPGWVTPLQMANLAAHMGVGYLSGALVGETLGLLTGLPESAQDRLKQTGMYSGLVCAIVPKIFGQD